MNRINLCLARCGWVKLAEESKQYTTELLKCQNAADMTANLCVLPQHTLIEEMAIPPTLNKVKEALSVLKIGTASRPDRITAEVFKYSGDDLA